MNRIKELRKQKGITMRKLSEDIGLKSEVTISRWENGKSDIRGKNLKKLAKYFNVSEAYLLGYSDDNQQLDWNSVVEYLSELSDFDYKKMIEAVDRKRGLNE